MSEREEFVNLYKKNRPNLSDSSIKTYISMLKNLYINLENTLNFPTTKYYIDNYEKVLQFLENNYNESQRKTILSALTVLTLGHPCSDEYQKQMLVDFRNVNKKYKEQLKSDTQNNNWITQAEIKDIYTKLEKEVKPYFKKKDLNDNEIQRLMDYIILSLYYLLPPRRILDYSLMKVFDIDKEKDNYIDHDSNEFVFNKYKTAKNYGLQRVKIPTKLKNILKNYIQIIKEKSNYLLFNKNGSMLASPQLVSKLNKIFNGRKISVNILRHSWITENLKIPRLKDMEQMAQKLGHNVETMMQYKKYDN